MGDISLHFSRHEFACKCGCGMDTVDAALLAALEDLREEFHQPITINSGNRCPAHNRAENGSPNSLHKFSKAADVVVKDVRADDVADYLEWKYLDKYGIGRYRGRTHIDCRSDGPARWDQR